MNVCCHDYEGNQFYGQPESCPDCRADRAEQELQTLRENIAKQLESYGCMTLADRVRKGEAR